MAKVRIYVTEKVLLDWIERKKGDIVVRDLREGEVITWGKVLGPVDVPAPELLELPPVPSALSELARLAEKGDAAALAAKGLVPEVASPLFAAAFPDPALDAAPPLPPRPALQAPPVDLPPPPPVDPLS